MLPELPEMETYRNLLQKKIVGQDIVAAEVNREKSINCPKEEFMKAVVGNSIENITRRGKHLVFQLQSGQCLLLHLMLGGLMYIETEGDVSPRTKQVILYFGDFRLCFIGLRLGYLHLLQPEEIYEEFADLGPEPLQSDFTFELFRELLDNRRGMLKTTLVNQHFIAGIGNCYSDEICFAAALLPMRQFDELNEDEIKRLYESIIHVLHEAIRAGGYMEQPLFKDDRFTGGYNKDCKVYDRGGKECFRCSNKIVKKIVSSKKTFFCPNCQH